MKTVKHLAKPPVHYSYSVARLVGLGLIAVVLMPGRPSHATHYQENIRRGSEIMMKDHRWPRWDSGTYYAIWYSGFHPKKEAGHSFYGGVPTRGPRGKPGMFWNFWGDTKGIHQGEHFYATGHGAEGASGAAAGKPDFLRPNAWYRFVMRVFPSKKKGEVGKNSCVAWWVKDIEKDTWHMHSMVRMPGAPTGFSHNRSFVEALAAGNVRRSIDRRLGYGRLNGEWYKADTVKCSKDARFMLIEDNTIVRYDSGVKEAGGRTSYTTTNQPDAPPLDDPVIADAVANVWRDQARVRWSVPRNASPQLGYRIEVFDNTRARGEPMVSADDNAPYMLSRRFDTPRPAKSVRLTVVDIFGQEKTVVLRARPIALDPRVTPRKVRQGLVYKFYTARGRDSWTELPGFAGTTPDKTGTVTELDDTVRENRRENYAIQYAGYVKVPADGLYVISAGTCDGSRLRVDGKQVYEYDGIHSAGIRQYPLALGKGLHRIELDYFKGPKAYPHVRVDMSWEGPGFARRPFARDDFVCDDAGGLPLLSLVLKTPVADGVLVDNLAEIHAIPRLRGHTLAKIEVFVGRLLLGTVKELDRNGRAVLKSVLPKGENHVWARLWYDGNNSVNADRDLRLNVKNRVDGPWTFSLMGPDINPLGARYKDGAMSFAGEGFYFAEQRITGDYTLTGRVADIILSTRENGIHGGNWVGLYDVPLFGHNKEKPVRGYNHENCGIYHTAGRGVRAMADWPDLGGGRISSWEVVGRDHRWLRIVRRGNRMTTYGSANGKTWKRASEQFCGSDVPVHSAGVVFRGIPGKSPILYRGTVDNISLQRTTPPEPARPKVAPKHLNLRNRITGVVQCRESPDRLYARSPTRGVLVSKDRGETWKEVNRGLSSVRQAMAVRSVAVHPKDPNKVLRAGGALARGVHRSGLWMSENGGQSWKLLTRQIDFDGSGPTALFGEVVAFVDAKGAELIAAAGESSGLSVSADAGKTWKSDHFKGEHFKNERITCMSVSGSTVLLGTFADAEFEALGLGRPSIRAPKATTGNIYFLRFRSAKSVAFGKKPVKVRDFGVTNIAFGMEDRFLSFATTRGIYYSWTSAFVVTQKRYRDLPVDTLYVAMGYRRFRKLRKDTQYDWKSTAYAAPFSSPKENLVYCVVERATRPWGPVSKRNQFIGGPRDAGLNPGPTCVLPDWKDSKTIYLCNMNGIYKSTDTGKTFRLVCESRAR